MTDKPENPFIAFKAVIDLLPPDFTRKASALGRMLAAAHELDLFTTNRVVEAFTLGRENKADPAPKPPVEATPVPAQPVGDTKVVFSPDPNDITKVVATPVAEPAASKPAVMGVVSINGWEHNVMGAGNIVIAGSKVVIDGTVIDVDYSDHTDVVEVRVLSGKIGNIITTARNVTANVVEGNLTTKGDASVGSVGGNATVMGDMSCSSVGGNATVTGDCTSGPVGGKITVSGDLTIK